MMGGVPLETCWAFNERWNNKFCYKVAYCWLFLLNIILYWNWVQNLHLHPRDFHVFMFLILFPLLYRNSCFVIVIMVDKRDKFQSMMPQATPLAKTSLRFYMNPTPEAKYLCISISWSLTERSGRWIYTILRESFTDGHIQQNVWISLPKINWNYGKNTGKSIWNPKDFFFTSLSLFSNLYHFHTFISFPSFSIIWAGLSYSVFLQITQCGTQSCCLCETNMS
jgi:hypothetical protein